MKTLIIIPTYNERDNIDTLLSAILAQGLDLDVLVVDDNSPDGTGAAVEEFTSAHKNVSLLTRVEDRGFGRAYVAGFAYALEHGYELIQTMDADLSHDPKHLPAFHAAIEEADFVVGSRYVNGISVINWPLSRLAMSTGANGYVRAITGIPLTDCTSGYTLFRASVLDAMNLSRLRANGYSFLVEIKYRTFKRGFRLAEVPIIFVERAEGYSKLSKRVFIESVLMPWRLRLGL